jgi:hypothetical protein
MPLNKLPQQLQVKGIIGTSVFTKRKWLLPETGGGALVIERSCWQYDNWVELL